MFDLLWEGGVCVVLGQAWKGVVVIERVFRFRHGVIVVGVFVVHSEVEGGAGREGFGFEGSREKF